MKPMEYLAKLQAMLPRRKSDATEPIAADVSETPYYREKSVVYATAQMVILMILAVFLAVSFLTGSGRLSVENWTLFISDLSSAVVLPEAGSTETLTYVADEQNRFASYRGGLAVLGKERLTVFTATGRENYTVSLGYNTPRLISSGKYLLAYDLGGSELSVYNSFTKLFDTVTDSPIRGIAVSEAGYFGVITDDSAYAGCVTLYDGDFDVISRFHLKEHTVCAAIADDGEQIAIASVASQEGRLQLTLLLAVPGESEAQGSVTLQDAYPLSMSYTEQGLMLLCSDRVYAIDRDGSLLGEYYFQTESVTGASLGAAGCVLLSRANNYNSDTRVLALDAKGEIAYDLIVSGSVVDAVMDESGALYLLYADALTMHIDGESAPRDTVALMSSYEELLPMGEGEIFVCGQARAVYVRLQAE
ncbi:MAG: hypothetical protein IJW40_02630 [Clostridia bacterium]|nr:hypothetical protein [Clostridia bacterium]